MEICDIISIQQWEFPYWWKSINSLAPGICGNDFKSVISNLLCKIAAKALAVELLSLNATKHQ